MSSFQFNAIQGALDLVNPPQGSNYLFQYYSGGEFAGASAVGYNPVDNKLVVGDQAETYGFFPTLDQKFTVNNLITAISGDEFPARLDIIRLLGVVSAHINPRANTAGTLGVTLYAAVGGSLNALGSVNWTGLPLGATTFGVSALGAFGTATMNTTGGTMEGLAGALYTTTHGGFGGTVNYLVGGMFDTATSDDPALGTPTGTCVNMYGGVFSTGGSGIDVTTAASGVFLEPNFFDAGTGAGVPAVTNKTALWVQGSASLKEQSVATAASITGLAVNSSNLVFTGSTATSLHGIAADTFPKVLEIFNNSSATVTLMHQSGTEGTAANRIQSPTGANVAILAGYTARLIYNTTASRWIVRI